jgi:hypothetical protein
MPSDQMTKAFPSAGNARMGSSSPIARFTNIASGSGT